MYVRRTRGNAKLKQLEKGIHGTLAEQNRAYAYIEGKHGGMADDWGYRLQITQLYKHDHETMMNFIKGYHDHEKR